MAKEVRVGKNKKLTKEAISSRKREDRGTGWRRQPVSAIFAKVPKQGTFVPRWGFAPLSAGRTKRHPFRSAYELAE
jgi:hypothetical protein